MKIGIELECIYNQKLIKMDVGDYHAGIRLNDFWETQRDSSIHRDHKFSSEQTCELVTYKLLESKKDMSMALKSLQKSFNSLTTAEEPLKELLYFNNSCGAHIHFSIPKYNFWRYASKKIFKRARDKFFSLLDNNKTIDEKIKEHIKKQYKRGYSKNITNVRQINDRSVEWNFCSERDGRGMEWRSFNVTGIETWENLFEMFEMAWKTLIWMSRECKKWSEKSNAVVEHKAETPEPIIGVRELNKFKNIQNTDYKMRFKKLIKITEIKIIPEVIVPKETMMNKVKNVIGRATSDSNSEGRVEVQLDDDYFLTSEAMGLLGNSFLGETITRDNVSRIINEMRDISTTAPLRMICDEDEEVN